MQNVYKIFLPYTGSRLNYFVRLLQNRCLLQHPKQIARIRIFTEFDRELLFCMGAAFHRNSFFIHHSVYTNRNISAIRFHDLNNIPHIKFIFLFQISISLFICLLDHPQIHRFALVSRGIIDLRFPSGLSKIKTGRKLTVSAFPDLDRKSVV